jgi:hypothetical protein
VEKGSLGGASEPGLTPGRLQVAGERSFRSSTSIHGMQGQPLGTSSKSWRKTLVLEVPALEYEGDFDLKHTPQLIPLLTV